MVELLFIELRNDLDFPARGERHGSQCMAGHVRHQPAELGPRAALDDSDAVRAVEPFESFGPRNQAIEFAARIGEPRASWPINVGSLERLDDRSRASRVTMGTRVRKGMPAEKAAPM
jgi:hypothetical protein